MNGTGAVTGKIRIAFLIDYYYSESGGTEKQLIEIVRRLDKNLFEPHLICLYSTQWIRNNPFPCPVHALDYRGFLKPNIFGILSRLRRMIRDDKYTIVQTFFKESIFVLFLATLCLKDRPALLSSRRDIGLVHQPWYHGVFRLLMPVVNLQYDAIVANGENVKRHVTRTEKVRAEKVRVIYNGIETRTKDSVTPRIFSERHPEVWIGISANFNPVKRLDVFLNALALLKNRHGLANVMAVHLGTGPEESVIRNLARKLSLEDHILFEGSVRNVGAYLQNLDIAVLCSDREGLSNSILEYMVYSLPVVATAVGGNTELVDGENGICVPPGNPEALADALESLVLRKELRGKMGRQSREKVERMFSWDKSMGGWSRLYLDMAAKVGDQMARDDSHP